MTSVSNDSGNVSIDQWASAPEDYSRRSNGVSVRHTRPTAFDRINNGGLGLPDPDPASSTVQRSSERVSESASVGAALDIYERQFLPGQPKSLSGIAVRSFALGVVLSNSVVLSLTILLFTSSPLWRLPFFIATLSAFHFLEFWTTARYNTNVAKVSSFLFSTNGHGYTIAHTAATLECAVTNYFWPDRAWLPRPLSRFLLILGLFFIVLGQFTRSMAMIEAGSNFNHVVQRRKAESHKLVTTGIYHYLRHPSYFGFFWWGLGTQLVLSNLVCFIGYSLVLWRFFFEKDPWRGGTSC